MISQKRPREGQGVSLLTQLSSPYRHTVVLVGRYLPQSRELVSKELDEERLRLLGGQRRIRGTRADIKSP